MVGVLMARDYARILTRIWADPDFRTLAVTEQHAYLMVFSDPALTYCGAGPLTVKRWANQSAGGTVRKIQTAIEGLAARRYLIIDGDTDEIMVRSLMRNDQVFRLPNVAKSAYASWRAVQSPVIRAECLFEVHRVHDGPASEWHPRTFSDEGVAEWLKEPLPEGLPGGFLKRFPEPLPRGFEEGIR
jgi:hypothetical protein